MRSRSIFTRILFRVVLILPLVMLSSAALQATPAPVTTKADKKNPLLSYESLSQMDEMVALGMPALALRLVQQEQPLWPKYSPDWYAFEYKRITLLTSTQQWQQLIKRTQSLINTAAKDSHITRDIKQWFITQQIIARLQLQQSEQALQQIRELLWNQKADTESAVIALWRRLVVRAYLKLGADEDAQKTLLRYRQDYPEAGEEWRMLQARVLLRTQRAAEVLSLLSTTESNLEHALYLIATVRANAKKFADVTKQAEAKLSSKEISKADYWAFSYVHYEAAIASGDLYKACLALEKLLALGTVPPILGEEFSANGTKLWNIYEKIGKNTGNKLNLLVGDDLAWYHHAGGMQKDSPIDSRALYAVLALNAHYADKRKLAHDALVRILAEQDSGLEIVNQLYLLSSRIKHLDNLPVEVRYRLVDYALTTGQITLAARLMETLPRPPVGENAFDWQLRTSRVLILSGEYNTGAKVLQNAVKGLTEIESAQLDQYLQVLFDLQAVKQHSKALKLFALVRDEWLTDQSKRELLFWKAQSKYAIEEYAHAALLYLRSARAADETMSDLWAHSARFKAAQSLAKAELFDDAKTMYLSLLSITADDARRAIIKQEIQHIQLLKNSRRKNSRKKNTNRETQHEPS